jgi:hypothetical protein
MPGERVSMRQIREVLRLRFASELPQRSIASRINSTFPPTLLTNQESRPAWQRNNPNFVSKSP